MNPTQAENLRILIRHMETNVTRTLDMRMVRDSCGTPACAAGEACTLDVFARIRGDLEYVSVAGIIQGLPFGAEASALFSMGPWNRWGRDRITPQEWAAEARKVLAENGYSMDEAKPIPSVRERLDAIYAARVLDRADVMETMREGERERAGR